MYGTVVETRTYVHVVMAPRAPWGRTPCIAPFIPLTSPSPSGAHTGSTRLCPRIAVPNVRCAHGRGRVQRCIDV